MLGLRQASALTSLSMTQTMALAASSLMQRRVHSGSRPGVRAAMPKSRPRMALSESVARAQQILFERSKSSTPATCPAGRGAYNDHELAVIVQRVRGVFCGKTVMTCDVRHRLRPAFRGYVEVSRDWSL